MAAGIAVAALALRAGLALRRGRLAGRRRPPELRRRHLRRAKAAVGLLAVGFLAGPPSMIALRGRDAFETFHGWIGLLVASLFAATALLGRRLERGRSRALDVHAALGSLALLAAAVAAVAGFILLP